MKHVDVKMHPRATLPGSSGWRQLCSSAYEALLSLPPIFLFAVGYFLFAPQESRSNWPRMLLFSYLAVCLCIYHALYLRIGQKTLAMASWKLRITSMQGGRPTSHQLLLRSIGALLSMMLCGIGHLWSYIDPERRYLHDRAAGTALLPDVPYR